MCKLKPGLHRELIAKVSSLKVKTVESRLSDLLFSVFVGMLVDFFIRWGGIFPLCFCFAVSVGY